VAKQRDSSFEGAVHPLLDLIDESLALDGIPLWSRPIQATWLLVTDFVIQLKLGRKRIKPPAKLVDASSELWFRGLYAQVEDWYRVRYRARLHQPRRSLMLGVTVIASTPFDISVPTTRSRVEVEGETAWLSFPNDVQAGEDVLAWIVSPPDWSTYRADSTSEAEERTRTVAGLLRSIACRLTGADISDPIARNLLAGIRLHLHSAAGLILRADEEGSYARAQWELQMACESGYKGLLQQLTGTFSETHDLFVLHDRACPDADDLRSLIRELPRWHQAAHLRYGLGDHPTLNGIFTWYVNTLRILSGVLLRLRGIDLSRASILLAIAPWLAGRQPHESPDQSS
jgi:hypothetical protein